MSTSEQPQATQLESSIGMQIDWANIIKQWETSGISQLAYCKANHINYKQFIYQRDKISSRGKAKPKVLPIKVKQPDHITPVQNNFILHYPNGLKLYIPVNAHPEAMKVLLNCFEDRSC